uniref:RNA-directed DNA polymerase from mobile element jockey n=1 Tax=Timema shepardi TaxID=629360 RepID=A0A7R9G3G7_TIMSH|nr:unnamed protein product [Timema shepardi]
MKLKGPRPFQKCLRPTPVPSNLQPREKVTAYLLDKERDREDRERSQEYSEGEHLNSEASESFINIKHKDSVISSEHQNLFNEVNNSCSKAFLEHKKIIPRSRSSSLEIHSHHDHHCRVDLLKSALHKDHIFSNNEIKIRDLPETDESGVELVSVGLSVVVVNAHWMGLTWKFGGSCSLGHSSRDVLAREEGGSIISWRLSIIKCELLAMSRCDFHIRGSTRPISMEGVLLLSLVEGGIAPLLKAKLVDGVVEPPFGRNSSLAPSGLVLVFRTGLFPLEHLLQHSQRNNIPHYRHNFNNLQNLEAAAVQVNSKSVGFLFAAIYKPPTKTLLEHDLNAIIDSNTIFVAGDLNSKHPNWNSRLTNLVRRTLNEHADRNDYLIVGPGEPTYYPSNPLHRPDIIDVVLTNMGVTTEELTVLKELDSDHNPVLCEITMNTNIEIRGLKRLKTTSDWEGLKSSHTNTLPENIDITTTEEADATLDIFINMLYTAITAWPTQARRKWKPIAVTLEKQFTPNDNPKDPDFVREAKRSGAKSNTHAIKAGVLQGSSLSQHLYKIYISDIPIHAQTKVRLFADHNMIYTINKNINYASIAMQRYLVNLQDWLTSWRIKVNAAKSAAIIISHRNKHLQKKTEYHWAYKTDVNNNIIEETYRIHLLTRLAWNNGSSPRDEHSLSRPNRTLREPEAWQSERLLAWPGMRNGESPY